MEILGVSPTTMVLGSPRGWFGFLFDRKVVVDRTSSQISVYRRLFGYLSKRLIPLAKVDSVKMSARMGASHRYVRSSDVVMRIYDTPRVRFDLWIDAMELGKVPLAGEFGPRNGGDDMESLGRQVARFMEKPFVNTARG